MITPVRIKFCGLTAPEDVATCVAAGAWAIGAVMTPHGPRALDATGAMRVMAEVPDGVERVGVFVDPMPADVAAAVERCALTRVQVHSPRDLAAIAHAAGVPVILAVPLDGPDAIVRADAADCDMVLFDAAVPGRHGGTGTRADWSLLEERRPRRAFALAGGLRPDLVGDAVRRVHPAVVDVASGVESSPGRKDPALVAAFAEAVRTALTEVPA